MKQIFQISILLLFILLFVRCKKDETGTLIFKGVDQIPALKSATINEFCTASPNQSIYPMHTKNLKTSVAEIWASKELVKSGLTDDFTWYKIGESTGLRFPDEYEFIADNLPEGEYQSLKILFRNTIIRYAVYQADTTQVVEMRGSLNEFGCESEDIITIFFSSLGNHGLENNKFVCTDDGENIRGFHIKAGQTTTIYWLLGWPGAKMTDCGFIWEDINVNRRWDCGIDTLRNFNCNKNYPMWTFSVDDGEIIPDDTTDVIEEPKFVIDTNYSVTDIVGNKYKAVKIGNQIWMAENLRTNKFNDNTQIINVPGDSTWVKYFNNLQQPAQCVYNNDVDFLRTYGRYYNWYAVSSGKLCPEGWHIPSKEEWQVLLDYLGENAGPMLRIAKGNLWSVSATNESMFSALPSGFRTFEGPYHAVYDGACWWSSTPTNNDFVYRLNLPGGVTGYIPFENDGGAIEKGSGLCVRCLKD